MIKKLPYKRNGVFLKTFGSLLLISAARDVNLCMQVTTHELITNECR